MAPPSVLLLDLDRTLVDVQSWTDYASALRDLRDLVHGWPDVVLPRTDWGAEGQAVMRLLVGLVGDPRWDAASAAVEVYERRAVPLSTPMPGLEEAIPILASQPVAVITLLPQRIATEVLRHHGIEVGVVVARSSTLRPKPYPDGLLAACRLLGAEPAEACMVGNATWDQVAATEAGAAFVGVTARQGVFGPEVRTAATLPAALRLALAG